MYRFYSTLSFIWIFAGFGVRLSIALGFLAVIYKIISLLWN